MDIKATITADLGPKVEATIAVDGIEVGLVTLTRMGELCLSLHMWASAPVSMWVASQPAAREAIWKIEQAVTAAALESSLVAS